MIAASVTGEFTVPARARELAARLSALFERDVEIVGRLNDAQSRLRDANERLGSGLAADAFGLIYDGSAPAGQSQIAKLCWGRCSRSTRRSIVPFARTSRRARSAASWRSTSARSPSS
jgi:hypothetical protein